MLQSGRKTPVFPVAVKGVVPHRGQVLVLRSRRGRWDLPGGKIAANESVEACLARETREEIGLVVSPLRLIDGWVRARADKPNSLVLVFLCEEIAAMTPALGDEHVGWQLFSLADVARLDLAARYRAAIAKAMAGARETATLLAANGRGRR